jgi:hypothetical protein
MGGLRSEKLFFTMGCLLLRTVYMEVVIVRFFKLLKAASALLLLLVDEMLG